MRKGWRNDPLWIAHYAERDRARIEREIERVRYEVNMRIMDKQLEEAMRNLRQRPPEYADE